MFVEGGVSAAGARRYTLLDLKIFAGTSARVTIFWKIKLRRASRSASGRTPLDRVESNIREFCARSHFKKKRPPLKRDGNARSFIQRDLQCRITQFALDPLFFIRRPSFRCSPNVLRIYAKQHFLQIRNDSDVECGLSIGLRVEIF